MPLTEQEREWLERRKIPCNRCGYFNRCSWKFQGVKCEEGGLFEIKAWGMKNYEVKNNFRDAAEFEARVAEKLAKPRKELRPKGCSWYETTGGGHLVRKTACPPHHDIDNCPGLAMCSIYHARIAAEADMDRKS
ncbi:hypothetical protein QUW42_09170 [Desulfovibrio piger]|uniref:hypothetical protein n=1 Tax=Desulfovibrio piger TaxID=901 RepID=UPI0025A368D1|nr:hypothetical protein [Desulfovibrio piger]MDM8330454.1 hypothetical protein [Desulfovibrio piger]